MKLIVFIVLFNFIFGARLKILDLLFFTSTILAMVSFFYFTFIKRKYLKSLANLTMLLFIGLSYSVLISGLFHLKDTTSIELFIKAVLYFMSSYFIVEIYFKLYKDKYEDVLIKHVFIVGVLNSIITISFYVSSSLRMTAINFLEFSDIHEAWAKEGRRIFDISMGGGSSGSVVFAVLFILGLNLLIKEKNKIKYLIGLLLNFVAIILTGRAGLYIVIICAPFYYYLISKLSKNNLKLSNKAFGYKNTLKIAIITIVLVFMTISFLPNSIKDQFMNTTAKWAFESLYNQRDGQGFTSQSMEVVFGQMYFIPKDNLIFGNSNFGRTGGVLPYIQSDVGYVRTLHALGILGIVIIYSPFIYLIFFAYKKIKMCYSANVLLFYSLITIVVNFKEFHYMPRGGASILFLLYFITLYSKKQNFLTIKHSV
jgi:hypothetical protein